MSSERLLYTIDNFMSIAHAEIDLTDNIISFCGYNDSGKSACLTGLAILCYDINPGKQQNYIKDGTDSFKLELYYMDSEVRVSKEKFTSGKSIWSLTKDNAIVYTNAVGNRITAVAGVPAAISRVLGVITATLDDSKSFVNAFLNYRRKKDRAFLVDTTGGENYTVLSTLLKNDVLARAQENIKKDRNELQSKLALESDRFVTYSEDCKVKEAENVSPDSLDKLDRLTKKLRASIAQFEVLQGLATLYNKLQSSVVPDVIDNVSLERFYMLQSLLDKKKECGMIIPSSLTVIDTSRLALLSSLCDMLKQCGIPIYANSSKIDMDRLIMLYDLICAYDKTKVSVWGNNSPIDLQRLSFVIDVCMSYNELYAVVSKFTNVSFELDSARGKAKALVTKYDLRVCKNCGALVE